MALLRLNPAFDAARNKLAAGDSGIVMYGLPSPNGNRQFLRNYVRPRNPNTPQQVVSRSIFAAVSSAWSLLTDDQAGAWNLAAQSVSLNDALERPYNPSGKAYYQAVNTYRQLDGQTISATPPNTISDTNWSVDDASYATDSGVGTLTLSFVFNGGTRSGFFQVRLTPPWLTDSHANLQAKPTDLRLPSLVTANCILAAGTTGPVVVTFTSTVLDAAIPGWALAVGLDVTNVTFGVQTTALSTTYRPGAVLFVRQVTAACTAL